MVQILCTHVCKWKNFISVETILGMGGEGIKDNGGCSKFKYDIFDIL
jgi:hypothetical protein